MPWGRRCSTPLLLCFLLSVWVALLLNPRQAAAAKPTPGAGEEDFYEVLGLGKERDDASERDIKSSWRKLSKKHHPDHAGESQREVYQRIQRAYEVLGDRKKRKIYDILGLDGVKKFEQPQDQQQQHMHPFFSFFGGGQQNHQADRGKNEELLLQVPLEDVYSGAAHTVKLAKSKICRACRGTGARSKEHLLRCPHCNGEGRILRRVQFVPGFVQQMEHPCPHCSGGGVIISEKCTTCKGVKTVRSTSAISIDIERGTPDGHVLTYELEADQQPNQVPGDVVFTVVTASHPRFIRSDNDLTVTVVLTLKEALLGFSKRLTHLDGHLVELKESGITQHGERRKIAGEGMPKHHVPSERGDLHVIYEVGLPSLLTAAQEEALRRAFG
ncbi:heat shock protein DnaJ [Trypanosoma rangeli]|uniref:Heat shock protein DnaJ n=1 Tax=Trypanosoma rangeli TaxID=5698 RepID=A0A3R7N2E5_TRYRA|nr:heat shock protein DnaJ [Trypanosoma rangeli]RNF11732.1 heat shock protein DnaJ [Trypanosoma rangeli]|eukprot:RNF11732.1 heat shock protein DnaJ [Trypanosoma rangeli]